MTSDSDQFAQQLIAAWNSHNPEDVAAFYDEDCQNIDVAQAKARYGRSSICAMFERYWQAFPDLAILQDATVREDDRLCVAWTAEGTHRGPLMHIPATGRRVHVRGMSLLTIRDGQVCEALNIWDVAGMLRALGLLPALQP